MAFGTVLNSAIESDIGDGTTNTIALGATATAGSLLTATVNWDKDAQLTGDPTCADNTAEALTVVYVEATDLTTSCAIAYKIADGDETEVTWTWDQTEDGCWTIYEWEGPFESSPADTGATATAETPATSLSIGPTATLAQAVELAIICGGQDSNSTNIAIDGVWVEQENITTSGGNPNHVMGSQITSATTALSGVVSADGSDEWSGLIQTFKQAAAGGATPKGPFGMPFARPFAGPFR